MHMFMTFTVYPYTWQNESATLILWILLVVSLLFKLWLWKPVDKGEELSWVYLSWNFLNSVYLGTYGVGLHDCVSNNPIWCNVSVLKLNYCYRLMLQLLWYVRHAWPTTMPLAPLKGCLYTPSDEAEVCSIPFIYDEVYSSLPLGSVYQDADAGQPYPIRCSLGDNCDMISPKIILTIQSFCHKWNYTPSILVYKDQSLTFFESYDGILKFNSQKR